MNNSETIKNLEKRMLSSVEFLREELNGMRTNRAHSGLVAGLMIDYHGTEMKLSDLAQISISDGRVIIIQLWDKGVVNSVAKDIEMSELGMQPNIDGDKIRLVVPSLNEERRKDLVKSLKKKSEDAKVAGRNVRRSGMDEVKELEKSGDISQDESRRIQTEIQKTTDSTIDQISSISQEKEKELMEI